MQPQTVTKTSWKGKGNECMEALVEPIKANIVFRAPMIDRQNANWRCNSLGRPVVATTLKVLRTEKKSKQADSDLIAEDQRA